MPLERHAAVSYCVDRRSVPALAGCEELPSHGAAFGLLFWPHSRSLWGRLFAPPRSLCALYFMNRASKIMHRSERGEMLCGYLSLLCHACMASA